MDDNILEIFRGLNSDQAATLRRRIVPTLRALRDEIAGPGPATAQKGEQEAAQAITGASKEVGTA